MPFKNCKLAVTYYSPEFLNESECLLQCLLGPSVGVLGQFWDSSAFIRIRPETLTPQKYNCRIMSETKDKYIHDAIINIYIGIGCTIVNHP